MAKPACDVNGRMPVSATEDVMNSAQYQAIGRVSGMTSDRVEQAWHDVVAVCGWSCQQLVDQWYRRMYAAGIVNVPPGNHPMTARKMRGAIRRLKAGEIGPNRIRPKVIAFMEQSMRDRPDIWQRLAES